MSKQFYCWVVLILFIFGFLITQSLRGNDTFINGAGASFPYPLYSKWIKIYYSKNSHAKINYQSIGSGGGIRQVLQGTVDFGATDSPMNAEESKKAHYKIWHVPTVMGSVVLTYNLPQFGGDLQLSPELLVDIYLGKLKHWNDPRLVELNPELSQISDYILPIRRSDGSGTTAIFTEYLSKVSPLWQEQVGQGKALKWPVGLGGKGNEGVTGLVKQNPGAIGYVEFTYARTSGLPAAKLQNAAGKFLAPSLESVSQAASGIKIPEDYKLSITNSANPDAYPIAAFTYLLIPENMPRKKFFVFMEFLDWALAEGQNVAASLQYAPLPQDLVMVLREDLQGLKGTKHGAF